MQTGRAPRYATDRALSAVRFWEDTPVRTVHGRCHVVSRRGLGATVADQLYIGEVVRLDLPPILRVYASVRNISGARHGFEFLFLTDSQQRAIQRLCDACLPQQLS